jgi:DNA (cytosine-5)-methyltransferase 1
MADRKPIQFIDLFAGVGGLSWGFMKARSERGKKLFEPLLLVDQDEKARESFLRNSGKFNNFQCKDISKLNAKNIRELAELKGARRLDLLMGGPPCQGFSRLTKSSRSALEDPRNELLRKFLNLAVALKPRIILFENVPAFKTFSEGRYIEETEKKLKRAGYKIVEARILNAAEHGVPQMRRRAIVIAIHKTVKLSRHYSHPDQLFPPHTTPVFGNGQELQGDDFLFSTHVSVEEAIGDLPNIKSGEIRGSYGSEPQSDYQHMMRNGSNHLYNHEARKHTQKFIQNKIKKIPEGGSSKDLGKGERFDEGRELKYLSQAYGRLHRKSLAYTITCHFLNPGSGRFLHYKDHRAITVREAARFQSFEDSFVFSGTLQEQAQQVGNAVPPLLARAIAENLFQLIKP